MSMARPGRQSLPPGAFFFVFALWFGPNLALGKSSRESLVDIKGRAAAQATHLYEALGQYIVAYPLSKDGFPVRSPDWGLRGGLRGAIWVGFDGAGYLYVSDAVLNQVRIYAPGASGDAEPVRVIPLPARGWPSAGAK